MQVISESQVDFDSLVSALKAGVTFVYPTETCYGLGCDATNFEAVEKVFEIKNRPKDKVSIVLFKNIEHLKQYVYIDTYTEQKVTPHWPGALTVRLPLKENTDIAALLVSPEHTISCRISPHSFIQKLFEYFDNPLVSTSANVSGEPAIYESQKVLESFLKKEIAPDTFIDAGDLALTPPSTVIEIKDGKIEVFRQGSVIIEE